VFYSTENHASGNNVDISPTLKVGSGLGIPSPPAVQRESMVRRLTPTECERLMGWPDGWTVLLP
jgi:DNA (cytosine-5)-methyltransferase 1